MVKIQLIDYAQGNMGALNFLMTLVKTQNVLHASIILEKIEQAKTLRGTNLWVLYSDLCEKDFTKVFNLCEACPTDILEDACSRQDYSGRKLVAQYLENH